MTDTPASSISEMRNLGIATQYHAQGRRFWAEQFPNLSWWAILAEASDNHTLEDVIIEKVAATKIEDQEHAARMLMAVVVYEMAFG